MKQWYKCKVCTGSSILDTLKIIDNSSLQIALVVDEADHLLGIVTDGDVRRAILRNLPLQEKVDLIMNARPVTASEREKRQDLIRKMRGKELQQLPIVDQQGRVKNLVRLQDLAYSDRKENIVVLMAGGLGTRLRPLTDDCPKPLLHVGGRPILETILDNFIEGGFYRFYLAVNYKAEMIEAHFANGESLGVDIRYLREEKPLGTAGALSLLPERSRESIIVMNGDLLTNINFCQMMQFHKDQDAMATMGVRTYDYQIPYGVVRFEKERIVGFQEKPVHRAFVNAGIYILKPEVLDLIPQDHFFDMPELFERVMQNEKKACAFPIREYWLDIGQMADFQKAQGEFAAVFR